MSGPHFRDYHLLLDEQAEQIFAMTDDIAERTRKIGGTTLHSVSDISRHQRLSDNNQQFVNPEHMLAELGTDNDKLIGFLRATHELCDGNGDVATASLIETCESLGSGVPRPSVLTVELVAASTYGPKIAVS